MTLKLDDVKKTMLEDLASWYSDVKPGTASERYIVCAGLAIVELLRTRYPLEESDYITERNQVRTGGSLIQSILKRFGEERVYAKEGGRTTRGTRPAAESLVSILNKSKAREAFLALSDAERDSIVQELHGWLVIKVREHFDQKRIEVEVDLGKSTRSIIKAILDAAVARKQGGAVAQHLVGAKLALRFPEEKVEDFSYTTADEQLGRQGDFAVGDSIFHVTMAPTEKVVRKCGDNIRNEYRPILVVPECKLAAARELVDQQDLGEKAGTYSIEVFVSQNIEELAKFGKVRLAGELRRLLELYNQRVEAIETDRSLLIEIPENLAANTHD